MSGRNQHVAPHNGRWGVKGEGTTRPHRVFDTQREAIQHGRRTAINQKSELLIHGKDGRIQARDSYGPDPHPPEG